MNKGKIAAIITRVDAEFTEQLFAIYNALTVEYELNGETAKLTLEVQQHLATTGCAPYERHRGQRGMDITTTAAGSACPWVKA